MGMKSCFSPSFYTYCGIFSLMPQSLQKQLFGAYPFGV
jgi:hypothetical protein